jgi:hypothetical protein
MTHLRHTSEFHAEVSRVELWLYVAGALASAVVSRLARVCRQR